MKNQKLLDALKTIKKECEKHPDNCDECKFYAENHFGDACLLTSNAPSDWQPWEWLIDHGSDK